MADEDLYTKWVKILTKTPRELCDILAVDCELKVKACQDSIKALFNDLAGHIAAEECDEIKAELEATFKISFDRMYAEKILTRNSKKSRQASPTKRPSTSSGNTKTASKTKDKPKNQPGPSRGNNKARRRGQGNRNNTPKKGNQAPKRQDLAKQLADLTRVIKQMK